MIQVKTLQLGNAKSNCYIVFNDKKETIIVDAGDNASQIIEFIELNKLKPLAILATHAHFDHISAVSELKKNYGIPFYIHNEDAKLLTQLNMYRHFIAKESFMEVPTIDVNLLGGENLGIGDFNINVIHTGVHTQGHCCFVIENAVFTGDILFKGRLDGTINKDKFVESYRKAINSILLLPETTKIFPGHGRSSSIAIELNSNNKLKELLKNECIYKTNCL